MQSNLRASSVFYNVVGGSQNLDCSPGRRGGSAGINVHTPLGSVPSFVVRHSRARVASAEPRGSRARRVVTARRSRVARWRVPGLDASMVAEPPDDDDHAAAAALDVGVHDGRFRARERAELILRHLERLPGRGGERGRRRGAREREEGVASARPREVTACSRLDVFRSDDADDDDEDAMIVAATARRARGEPRGGARAVERRDAGGGEKGRRVSHRGGARSEARGGSRGPPRDADVCGARRERGGGRVPGRPRATSAGWIPDRLPDQVSRTNDDL